MIERRKGTYVKLEPNEKTKEQIAEIINQINLVNSISVHDLHVTVVYSRVECPAVEGLDVELPILAEGSAFDIFPNGDNTNCLVLKLASKEMQDLHQTCKKVYGATHDFPSYNPHITLSYDYPFETVPNESLLEFFTDLRFDKFIVEPLDLNWKSE